ncbi:MAG: alpha/beta fold hydrolase [Actinomycetota bacterium]
MSETDWHFLKNPRKYGRKPYSTAVLHGGPGVYGQMAQVAEELSPYHGILEPAQTGLTIAFLLNELHYLLSKNSRLPVNLIGWSWGALLGLMFAEKYPRQVKKLVMVGCPPLEEKYAAGINITRMERLDLESRQRFEMLSRKLQLPRTPDKDTVLAEIGELALKSDSYDLCISPYKPLSCSYKMYNSVWAQVKQMRKEGKLLKTALGIQCPLAVVHGDYDPHPWKGVFEPLKAMGIEFKPYLIKRCGHYPWLEKHGRKDFFAILKSEIGL